MKILIVEDEKLLAESVEAYLSSEGFICETVFNFDDGIEKINLYQYDCAVVDITIPGGTGLDIIKELIKIRSTTGIIIISAKTALDDKIEGLEIGADDYLTKPFHLPELNARIKSLIRRRKFEGKNEIRIDDIIILPDEVSVRVNDQVLDLTRKEYELLLFFVANKNKVLSKAAIAEHLWGDQIDMADSFDFIYTHIKNLRKKILEKGGKDYIQTNYGLGYIFRSE